MFDLKRFTSTDTDELYFINGGSGYSSRPNTSSNSSTSEKWSNGPYKVVSETEGCTVYQGSDGSLNVAFHTGKKATHVDNKPIDPTPSKISATGLRG